MARRKTVAVHHIETATGQRCKVQTLNDGSLRIVIPASGEQQKWAVTHVFTGGEGGTQITLERVI